MAAVDPGMTFESFVVGPENRLAWEAARTAAESPGTAYNPLFIYSATGLGKTHLLVAMANRAKELDPGQRIIYTPVDDLLHEVAESEEAESTYRSADILLIDDIQFLPRHRDGDQVLFHVLDHLLMAGKQVALASDRPPLEMDELDDRLLSRFSGGLVVDIGRPVLETRRAILERRLGAIGASLRPEVIDRIARLAIENVRQLKGALNRVLAAQKAESREIEADEVDRLLKNLVSDPDLPWLAEEGRDRGEFEAFLSDVSTAVEEALGSPKWREDIARAILKWEAEGYVTKRLEDCLDSDEPVDAGKIVAAYERDIASLKTMQEEFQRLGMPAPDALAFRDPDRLDELREMLTSARRTSLAVDDFFLDDEKVVWDWPVPRELLIESWDDGDQG
jgi:hypothetical protein